jgi:hypothetical protein
VRVAPGVRVDVERVAVLSEAVDEGADARGVVKDRAPEFVGKVGGDHNRALLVTTTDDVKEQVGGARIAGHISELVEDEQVRCGVASESSFGRRK